MKKTNIKKFNHNTNCCVFNCHSMKVKNPNLHFHYFPKGKLVFLDAQGKRKMFDRRKKWEKALLMKKRATKYLRVCSLHFKETDYRPTRCANNVVLRLQPFAVPSLNLPVKVVKQSTNNSTKKKYDQQRMERLFGSSPVKVEVKEENQGNDYLLAKGRLKVVLKQLVEKSSEEESESSDDSQNRRRRGERKKRSQSIPTPLHHTYVMKLYDRSVDLAKFEEDTPLYPLCRAWMENQPKNPQKNIKRSSSPEAPIPDKNWEKSPVDVKRLPPPSKPFETRVPSPLAEQLEQNKDNINLDYEECPPVDKNILIKNHLQRWIKVKKNWIQAAAKNENRYTDSFKILQTIYNKAQEHIE